MSIKNLELYDPWATAYAVATGVKLITAHTDAWTQFVLDDTDGQASRAFGQWRSGKAVVNAKVFAEAYRHVKQVQYSSRQSAQDERK